MVYQESSTPSKVMEKKDEKEDEQEEKVDKEDEQEEKVDKTAEEVKEQARRMVTCVLFFCLKSAAFQIAYLVCDFCNLQVLPSSGSNLQRQNAFVEVKEEQEVEGSEEEGEDEKKIEKSNEEKKRKAEEIIARCSRIRRSGVLGFISAHKYCTSSSQVSHSSYVQ